LTQRVAGGFAVALLLFTTAAASAQAPAGSGSATVPQVAPTAAQYGFILHQSADLGGHIAGIVGSGAMYDTLVNLHTGPRVLGQTFTLHAVPGSKHPFLDSLSAFSNGFGGDPINFAKLDASKGKLYEFSGNFRRDRQYFDYDLLNNPNLPTGGFLNIGPAGSLGKFAIPQIQHSPVMFNTVRRMTDTELILLPLAMVTFRLGYAQDIFQGPSRSPSRSVGKTQFLTEEFQRNSTDDFLAAVDWKPAVQTRFTFEEQVTHIKENSYFILDPTSRTVQEADGTRVALGNWDQYTAYPSTNCTSSIKTAGVVLVSASGSAGLPVVDPACDVYSSYLRSQPTRILYPTEIFTFQSSSLRNIAMSGDFTYTKANSNLPHFYENFQGLDGTVRAATFTGNATAQRRVVAGDFGITWQATKAFSFSDQFDYSNAHQPGVASISAGIGSNTPATIGSDTINYAGTLVPGTNLSTSGITTVPVTGAAIPAYGYFGQKLATNHATVSWDTNRATLALTYRYRSHVIAQNAASGPDATLITINENGGILNAAVRPSQHLDINGTAELFYADNALTSVSPRQTRHFRIHALYKPTHWATFTGAFNDLERHNNTNNITAANDPGIVAAADGPLDHVDHSRFASIGAVFSPNPHYGLDLNYAFSDVYTATNICFLSGATAALPGVDTGKICPDKITTWLGRDFMDAPTQYASIGLALTPVKSIHTRIGYRISAVSGNQFFTDALQVNGSLQSAYQTPYVHVAWTVHPGWVWAANYDYFGYGEGGPSGALICSSSTSATAVAFPCPANPPSGASAPRNFHANLVTLSMHYEF
jgi:hypothetical protein